MPTPRIRELREAKRLTQGQLADAMAVHESTISRWESGECPIPDWRKQQMADFLGCSVTYLMRWDTEEEGQGNGHDSHRPNGDDEGHVAA